VESLDFSSREMARTLIRCAAWANDACAALAHRGPDDAGVWIDEA
jgi:asparagine synthetase B (glutamine-hydrolysing)